MTGTGKSANKYDHVKRYAIVMAVGVILNFGLYYIAHVFHLPLWMDNIGTAYAAMALEPAAGLLVAFVSNFYQAAVVYDSSSLIYYMVSASVALVVGIGIRNSGRIQWKRLGMVAGLYVVVGTVLAGSLTLWRTAGVPDSGWERSFYEAAVNNGIPNVLACYWGTVILKAADAVMLSVLLPVLYMLTPKGLITQELKEVVSWKNKYFVKSEEEEESF